MIQKEKKKNKKEKSNNQIKSFEIEILVKYVKRIKQRTGEKYKN